METGNTNKVIRIQKNIRGFLTRKKLLASNEGFHQIHFKKLLKSLNDHFQISHFFPIVEQSSWDSYGKQAPSPQDPDFFIKEKNSAVASPPEEFSPCGSNDGEGLPEDGKGNFSDKFEASSSFAYGELPRFASDRPENFRVFSVEILEKIVVDPEEIFEELPVNTESFIIIVEDFIEKKVIPLKKRVVFSTFEIFDVDFYEFSVKFAKPCCDIAIVHGLGGRSELKNFKSVDDFNLLEKIEVSNKRLSADNGKIVRIDNRVDDDFKQNGIKKSFTLWDQGLIEKSFNFDVNERKKLEKNENFDDEKSDSQLKREKEENKDSVQGKKDPRDSDLEFSKRTIDGKNDEKGINRTLSDSRSRHSNDENTENRDLSDFRAKHLGNRKDDEEIKASKSSDSSSNHSKFENDDKKSDGKLNFKKLNDSNSKQGKIENFDDEKSGNGLYDKSSSHYSKKKNHDEIQESRKLNQSSSENSRQNKHEKSEEKEIRKLSHSSLDRSSLMKDQKINEKDIRIFNSSGSDKSLLQDNQKEKSLDSFQSSSLNSKNCSGNRKLDNQLPEELESKKGFNEDLKSENDYKNDKTPFLYNQDDEKDSKTKSKRNRLSSQEKDLQKWIQEHEIESNSSSYQESLHEKDLFFENHDKDKASDKESTLNPRNDKFSNKKLMKIESNSIEKSTHSEKEMILKENLSKEENRRESFTENNRKTKKNKEDVKDSNLVVLDRRISSREEINDSNKRRDSSFSAESNPQKLPTQLLQTKNFPNQTSSNPILPTSEKNPPTTHLSSEETEKFSHPAKPNLEIQVLPFEFIFFKQGNQSKEFGDLESRINLRFKKRPKKKFYPYEKWTQVLPSLHVPRPVFSSYKDYGFLSDQKKREKVFQQSDPRLASSTSEKNIVKFRRSLPKFSSYKIPVVEKIEQKVNKNDKIGNKDIEKNLRISKLKKGRINDLYNK